MKQYNFKIVMRNPKASNPEALTYLVVGFGTWAEAAKLVDQYRVQYPECFVGVKFSC